MKVIDCHKWNSQWSNGHCPKLSKVKTPHGVGSSAYRYHTGQRGRHKEHQSRLKLARVLEGSFINHYCQHNFTKGSDPIYSVDPVYSVSDASDQGNTKWGCGDELGSILGGRKKEGENYQGSSLQAYSSINSHLPEMHKELESAKMSIICFE